MATQALIIIAIGLVVGLTASSLLMRLIATQLHGVTATDPATFVLVPLLLTAVASLACIAPVLRAARLDPLRVLRGM